MRTGNEEEVYTRRGEDATTVVVFPNTRSRKGIFMPRKKTVGSVRRDDSPPRPGPGIPVRRIRGGTQQKFLILSSCLHGYWSHWDRTGKRTVACTGESSETCDGHQKKLPSRWKGFLHCLEYPSQREAFLEITPGGAELLRVQLPSLKDTRGYRLSVGRSSNAVTSRLVVDVMERLADPATLPAERDPTPYIEELWGTCPRIATVSLSS